MYLNKLEFKNYRLLVDTQINIDHTTTLIVGRNNTAKTSCMEFLKKVIGNEKFSFNDYPLSKREEMFELFSKFLNNEIDYIKLKNNVSVPSLRFYIDYSLENAEEYLGALSPFIIDVDEMISTVEILANYQISMSEEKFSKLLSEFSYEDESNKFILKTKELRLYLNNSFHELFNLVILAINPNNKSEQQLKTPDDLKKLFPIYTISAERYLDEGGISNVSSLKSVIDNFFKVDSDKIPKKLVSSINELKKIVKNANGDIQENTDKVLSELIQKSIGFGYPNSDELQLGVSTKVEISNDIVGKSELNYYKNNKDDCLPSNYNGLGYKNLIKIQFQLKEFCNLVNDRSLSCIPILFVEEPESHMHPQMQQRFIEYLEDFIQKNTETKIQTLLTTHSSHIANTVDFSKIRYAQKSLSEVSYKDLGEFAKIDQTNTKFIEKYLTISKCDLFFADKAILVEGASERILLPDMINKCAEKGYFNSCINNLKSQYYTLVEVGGAYAHIFVPFMDFLGIPTLILTDIDPYKEGIKKALVSEAVKTTNSTIKWWIDQKKIKEVGGKELTFNSILNLKDHERIMNNVRIDFQVQEKGLCGRSLEESIMNVNRSMFGLSDKSIENDLRYDGKSKMEFALNLIMKDDDYEIPKYIVEGLKWLDSKNILN